MAFDKQKNSKWAWKFKYELLIKSLRQTVAALTLKWAYKFKYELLTSILLGVEVYRIILFLTPKFVFRVLDYEGFVAAVLTASLALAGVVVHKFYFLTKVENFCLKKDMLLFYVLSPESKYEIYRVLRHGRLSALIDFDPDAPYAEDERGYCMHLERMLRELNSNPVVCEIRANPERWQNFKEEIRKL